MLTNSNLMLGVVYKFISNISSKSPPNISEFIDAKAEIYYLYIYYWG
jgi:hypothetical protein